VVLSARLVGELDLILAAEVAEREQRGERATGDRAPVVRDLGSDQFRIAGGLGVAAAGFHLGDRLAVERLVVTDDLRAGGQRQQRRQIKRLQRIQLDLAVQRAAHMRPVMSVLAGMGRPVDQFFSHAAEGREETGRFRFHAPGRPEVQLARRGLRDRASRADPEAGRRCGPRQ